MPAFDPQFYLRNSLTIQFRSSIFQTVGKNPQLWLKELRTNRRFEGLHYFVHREISIFEQVWSVPNATLQLFFQLSGILKNLEHQEYESYPNNVVMPNTI